MGPFGDLGVRRSVSPPGGTAAHGILMRVVGVGSEAEELIQGPERRLADGYFKHQCTDCCDEKDTSGIRTRDGSVRA